MSQTVIHQFLPGARSGDAITDQAFMMRGWLREMGYVSHIYAQHIDADIESEIRPLSHYRRARNETWAIYHHSIGSGVPYTLRHHKLRLILIYHNVTPPQFFADTDPMLAYQLRLGIDQLGDLRPITGLALADSPFNAIDLEAAGYENRALLPIALQPQRFDAPINADLAARLNTTRPNILFIGRLAPNKAQTDLIRLLYHLRRIQPTGHLYLVGDREGAGYDVWLEQLVQELGLGDNVTLTGKVSEEDKITYLKGADLYVSMSEHEGFGVPLIESMYLGLPVLAYGAAAVPNTMGNAGVLFSEKKYEHLAEFIHLMLEDESLRRRIVNAQHQRVQAFMASKVQIQFEDHLWKLGLRRIKKRIAIVVQRYGEEVNGGAETLARSLAEHLLTLADVQVITTCAVDHITWANAYPPGESELSGVTVHRFEVDALRAPDFLEQTAELLHEAHSVFDELEWLKAQGPVSSGLIDYIWQTRHFYDVFIFVTYLYAPTYFGLSLVSDKAVLIPTAHDEPYLHLPMFRPLFHLPQHIVYSTEPEQQLVNRVMDNHKVRQAVVGVGIDMPADVSADRFRRKYNISDPFLVYAGRIEQGKNVPELLEFFIRLRQDTGLNLKLVLLGKANMDLPDDPDVVALGFVSEQDKFDAFRAATALVMPSLYESLSMVVLEAWTQATPVLVNGHSEVLKYQCEQSGGGLYYHDYAEFVMAVRTLLEDGALRSRMGSQGQAYVAERYNWDTVLTQYRLILETIMDEEQQGPYG